MKRQSSWNVAPGMARNVTELMRVAIMENATTHPGIFRLAKK